MSESSLRMLLLEFVCRHVDVGMMIEHRRCTYRCARMAACYRCLHVFPPLLMVTAIWEFSHLVSLWALQGLRCFKILYDFHLCVVIFAGVKTTIPAVQGAYTVGRKDSSICFPDER